MVNKLILFLEKVNDELNDFISDLKSEFDEGLPKWYLIAQREIGQKEIPGKKHNLKVLEYHATTSYKAKTDEVPWCSSFVNWCIEESGVEGTGSAAARSWTDWGQKLDSPKIGCVVVFKRGYSSWAGHVGFYAGDSATHIKVLGGNQSNSVKYSLYNKKDLLGFRWPN